MFEIFLSPTVACSMYLCSICNVEVPHTPFNIQQHESGSKHQIAKNNQLSSIGIGVKENANGQKVCPTNSTLRCVICDFMASSTKDLLMHKKGRRHWEAVKNNSKSKKESQTKSSLPSDICDFDASSTKCFLRNESGRRHWEAVKNNSKSKKESQTKSSLRCDICDFDASSTKDLLMHKSGKKHLQVAKQFADIFEHPEF